MSLTTDLLLNQIQGGNRAAVNQLLVRYQERIHDMVRERLGQGLRRKVEASDIVQEVMIKAFKKLWKQRPFDFSREGGFRGYIAKVVEHCICDEADRWSSKKRNRNLERSLEDAGQSDTCDLNDLLAADLKTPGSKAALREEIVLLEKALDILGRKAPDARYVVEAVNRFGLPYVEVAKVMGITPDAVRMRVNRAIESLNAILHGMGMTT